MTSVNPKERAADAAKASNGASLPNLAAAGSAPLYEQVKRHMSEAILVGEWEPGTVLPGEVALSQSFGVAVGTIRRAMADLVAEGLLTRRRKTGTVVTGRSPHHSLRFFFQYFRLHDRSGGLVRSRVKMLSAEIRTATPEEAEALRISDAASVLHLHRVRQVDGEPVMHDRLSLPAERVPDFPLEIDAIPELLYLYLLERYGIRISVVREELATDMATEEDAKLLAVRRPSAVLTIAEVAFDQGGQPMIYATHRASTAKHVYVNEVR